MAQTKCNRNCDSNDPEMLVPASLHYFSCPVWAYVLGNKVVGADTFLAEERFHRREPDAQTYRLGHWEQMQFALALDFVRTHLEDHQTSDRWENLDADYLRSIQHLFQADLTSITTEEAR